MSSGELQTLAAFCLGPQFLHPYTHWPLEVPDTDTARYVRLANQITTRLELHRSDLLALPGVHGPVYGTPATRASGIAWLLAAQVARHTGFGRWSETSASQLGLLEGLDDLVVLGRSPHRLEGIGVLAFEWEGSAEALATALRQ